MSEVKVDTISERTAANGIVVDGVTIKDNGLTIPSGGTLDVNGTLDVAGATVTGLSAGKVLQCQSKDGYTGLVKVDGVTTYVTCGDTFKISLTPNEASSKIIITFGSNYVNYGAGTQYTGRLKMYRQIAGGGYIDIEGQAASVPIVNCGRTADNSLHPFSMTFVDSNHNTTSAVDYQLYMSSSNNVTCQFADGTGSYRFITAIEVST